MSRKILLLAIITVASLSNKLVAEKQQELPTFWKSTLIDVQSALKSVKAGQIKGIATTPGGRSMVAVFYGVKDDLRSQANYNSAVAAGNPAYYAVKDSTTKLVVFFVGPVHGQEVEGIVGLLNLINVAETGKDYRGKGWSVLKNLMNQCRTVIIPLGNPDGRARCPHDSWVGLNTETMTKYGQGSRKDGSLYGWPGAIAVHPIQGDVHILGAYFNDNGINSMHDDFFNPMAAETKALLDIARSEAPDITVSLHSHENKPVILQPNYLPLFLKKKIFWKR